VITRIVNPVSGRTRKTLDLRPTAEREAEIVASAAKAGLPLRRVHDGLFMVDVVGRLVTVSSGCDGYHVRRRGGKRWRTLGKWKRIDRAIAEAKFWGMP